MNHKQMVALMGRKVLVEAILKREFAPHSENDKNGKEWREHENAPRVGWVVGFRWLLDGYTKFSGFGGDDPPVFMETGRKFAILVAFWPTMKPVPATRLRELSDPTSMPESPNELIPPDKEYLSDLMRKEMAGWPRDSKGRWVKK